MFLEGPWADDQDSANNFTFINHFILIKNYNYIVDFSVYSLNYLIYLVLAIVMNL